MVGRVRVGRVRVGRVRVGRVLAGPGRAARLHVSPGLAVLAGPVVLANLAPGVALRHRHVAGTPRGPGLLLAGERPRVEGRRRAGSPTDAGTLAERLAKGPRARVAASRPRGPRVRVDNSRPVAATSVELARATVAPTGAVLSVRVRLVPARRAVQARAPRRRTRADLVESAVLGAQPQTVRGRVAPAMPIGPDVRSGMRVPNARGRSVRRGPRPVVRTVRAPIRAVLLLSGPGRVERLAEDL